MQSRPGYEGVIFDMDGTLIEPLLDFSVIRRELGIAGGDGILEAIERMPPGRQAEANAILLGHELRAAREAAIMPGAGEVVSACRAAGLKTAMLTRNTSQAADIVLRRFPDLRFDLVLCREDGVIKPEPDGVLAACRQLGIAPARTVCVGDFHYDIIAANAAGAVSVLLKTADPRLDQDDWADEADYRIDNMDGLLTIVLSK